MNTPRVAIIILAAGTSSRLGQPKQLLDLGGEPLIRHTVRNAEASSASEVVLVVGSRGEEVASAAAGDGRHQVVFNPDFAHGQSTSLVAGISSLSDEVDAALLMLGDQPTVEPTLLDAIMARFSETGAKILRPRYQDGPGNPVLFHRDLFGDLLKVTGDLGARDLIQANKHLVAWFEVDALMPPDVDSDSDYQALRMIWDRDRRNRT